MYIVGSGWWSDKPQMLDFFDLWYEKVSRFTFPGKIVIANSCSPILPDFNKYDGIFVVDLVDNFNAKGNLLAANKKLEDNTGIKIQRTAGMRQLHVGAWYAYYNDADFYVWIEQDCLIHGEVIEQAIADMNKAKADYSMGLWDHKFKLETSLVIYRISSLPKIWNAFCQAKSEKPELRYWKMKDKVKFCPLSFGYGRNRPIHWKDDMFFAQHLTEEEIEKFKEK